MTKKPIFAPIAIILINCITSLQNANATGFLPQDARALAMGGAGVAVGNSRQAHYYNPSLLINAPEDEDFNFESDVAIRIADSDGLINGATDFADNDPISSLVFSIDAFNTTPTSENLETVINDATLLQSSIHDVTNKSFTVDGNVGTFVSVPNKKISWALYMNAWANVAFTGNLSDQDNQVMTQLIDNANSVLDDAPQDITDYIVVDPTDTLSSSIRVQGAGVVEFGIALAKKQSINNYELDIGITPKIQRVTTYGVEKSLKELEESIELGEELDFSDQEDPQTTTSFNIDIGVSKELDDNWTTGIVIKNLIPKSYDVNNSTRDVEISPSARIGAAWRNNWISAGLDLDLTKNDDIASLSETQFLSLGAEFDVKYLQLRGGFRHNLASSGGSGPSVGFGLYLLGLNLDAAVASNSFKASEITDINNINASIQLGINW